MSNKTPTAPLAPGWYYRDMPAPINCIVWVRESVHFGTAEPVLKFQYQESSPWHIVKDDGLWLGPVPMPGEWAPMEMFNQLWTALAAKTIGRGSADYQLLQRARAWDDPEETP